MATIDYKEKYEQALEVAQRFYNNSVAITNKGLEDIFPELKESEDERIRKAIYNCVKWFGFDSCFFKDVSQEECLAWLEKKPSLLTKEKALKNSPFVEQKPAWSEEDEKILDRVITNYESGYLPSVEKRDEIIEKLKSLKERYTWKPSDEQIEALNRAMYHVEDDVATQIAKLIGDLKKLKGE